MEFFKKISFSVATILILFCVSSCFNKKSSFLLINVLDKQLYDDLHIAGSEHVPFEELENKLLKTWHSYDKKTVFVFYCSNYACTASADAVRMMQKAGFTKSYAYEGGMAEWFNLHKTDKSYRIVGIGQEVYLTRANEPLTVHTDVPVITADELKAMLQKTTRYNT